MPKISWAAEADIIIRHAKVISPPNVIDDATVVVSGNRISYVGNGKVTQKAKRYIDASNKTVIPGMIDTHVHLIMGPNSPDSDEAYEKWVQEKLAGNLKDLLAHGFTTIASMGDYFPQVLGVRERVNSGQIIGPRLMITGPLLIPVNGHVAADNDACTKVPFCVAHMTRQIANAEEGRKAVRELAAAKVDGIKIAICEEGNNGIKIGHFSDEELRAIIDEAHVHGLRVYVHAYPYDYALRAIEAGADALAHGPEMMEVNGEEQPNELKEKVLALAKQRGVSMAVTMGWPWLYPDTWGGDATRVAYNTSIVEKKESLAYWQYANKVIPPAVRHFDEQGVNLAWGTDLWQLRRFSDGEKFELQARAASGIPPMHVLAMATTNAAKHLNREKDIGAIEKGKLADLVIIAGDPLKNLDGFMERIDMVIKDGKVMADYYAPRGD